MGFSVQGESREIVCVHFTEEEMDSEGAKWIVRGGHSQLSGGAGATPMWPLVCLSSHRPAPSKAVLCAAVTMMQIQFQLNLHF